MEHVLFFKAAFFFFFFFHRISGHAGKRAMDRSRSKDSGGKYHSFHIVACDQSSLKKSVLLKQGPGMESWLLSAWPEEGQVGSMPLLLLQLF